MHRAVTSLITAAAIACAALVTTARGETVYASSRYSGTVLAFEIGATAPTSPVVSSTISSGLALPTGLAFGGDGRLYIVEAGVFDPDTGEQLVAPGVSRHVSGTAAATQRILDLPDTQPASLTVAADGDLIVGSLSQGGTASGALAGSAVYRVSSLQATPAASPYSSVSVPGLVGAAGLAIDGLGRLYISNGNGYSGSVVRLDSGTSSGRRPDVGHPERKHALRLQRGSDGRAGGDRSQPTPRRRCLGGNVRADDVAVFFVQRFQSLSRSAGGIV